MDESVTPTPYNFCDYRCDRCDERLNCRVYREEQARLQEHYDRGEDPYDPEIFMSDLKRIFRQTETLIKHAAEQGGAMPEEEPAETPQDKSDDYVLYRQAFEYSRHTRALIRQIEAEGLPDSVREAFSDVVWHHTLIAAKAGRLVSGFIDNLRDAEAQKQEEEGTLGVMKKSIDLSRQGLERLKSERTEHSHTISDLLEMLTQIEQTIQTGIRRKVG